jgi:hypothetical protein
MMEEVHISEILINCYGTTLQEATLPPRESQISHINWMFISAQVQGLNIPMRRGTMAGIHESESSLNESYSASQEVKQDEGRYDYILTDKPLRSI